MAPRINPVFQGVQEGDTNVEGPKTPDTGKPPVSQKVTPPAPKTTTLPIVAG
jgi:hypothetical protein